MRRACLVLVTAVCLAAAPSAAAHYHPAKPKPYAAMTLAEKEAHLERLARHASYVKRRGSGQPRRWHARALLRIRAELAEVRDALRPRPPHWSFWRLAQIWLAQTIAPLHRDDAWPNCPDPYAGGGSWDDTMRCEARGTWESAGNLAWAIDPPGQYRCALQFQGGPDGWEARYRSQLLRRFGVAKVCP